MKFGEVTKPKRFKRKFLLWKRGRVKDVFPFTRKKKNLKKSIDYIYNPYEFDNDYDDDYFYGL